MAWRSIWYDDTKPEPDAFIERLKDKGFHYSEAVSYTHLTLPTTPYV